MASDTLQLDGKGRRGRGIRAFNNAEQSPGLLNMAGCQSLALGLLQLVGERKLGGLLLQLGKLVLVLAHLFQGRLNELALHVGHGDGQLIDLEVTEDNLTLQEKHLSLKSVPFVKIVLADLFQFVHVGGFVVGLGAAPLGDDAETLLCLALLLLLQLLCCLLTEEGTQLLLPLGGHESLLLGHFVWFVVCLVNYTHLGLNRNLGEHLLVSC